MIIWKKTAVQKTTLVDLKEALEAFNSCLRRYRRSCNSNPSSQEHFQKEAVFT